MTRLKEEYADKLGEIMEGAVNTVYKGDAVDGKKKDTAIRVAEALGELLSELAISRFTNKGEE